MADDSLIVPVVVPSGTLHFATLSSGATVQDLLDDLTTNEEITLQLLGDLQPYGWAIQHIRKEHSGRQWEEEELEALGNGKLPALRLSCTLTPVRRHCKVSPVGCCHSECRRIH